MCTGLASLKVFADNRHGALHHGNVHGGNPRVGILPKIRHLQRKTRQACQTFFGFKETETV